ncbi:TetR family transcriptional regulator C-terminal domain-containing protein [Streptomyces smyrnaeus]|uniref:TetR/AcrR family transcriptional regulator n=1 Tax=Streptomyces TaxID=1883 RepID=UPI0016117BDE|nr:TetR/AcrR family transcriptional regulator [Streptomyces sp. B15]MBQ1121962.1 TetR/AcrR family transcriptional regulator [Streptomyces sp. B15]
MKRSDGRVERGNQTRRLVLDRAVRVASCEGLDGLSLGRLAGELQLSKSGVFTLFGSKEELQLATVRAATRIYTEHVVRPAQEAPAGLHRVVRLYESWLSYSRERVFPGGCFFFSVSAEFDAREGRVHDSIAQARADWTAFVERTLDEARQTGELAEDTDVPQLAFEIIALLEAGNAESVLHGDASVDAKPYERARRGIRHRLAAAATDPAALPAGD